MLSELERPEACELGRAGAGALLVGELGACAAGRAAEQVRRGRAAWGRRNLERLAGRSGAGAE
jgi:hypothetical protein